MQKALNVILNNNLTIDRTFTTNSDFNVGSNFLDNGEGNRRGLQWIFVNRRCIRSQCFGMYKFIVLIFALILLLTRSNTDHIIVVDNDINLLDFSPELISVIDFNYLFHFDEYIQNKFYGFTYCTKFLFRLNLRTETW